MTRNWNIVRARLADPFEPHWDRVNQQVQAMIAEQDAHGGHVYPPFRLPNPLLSASSGPAEISSPLVERPRLTRAVSTDVASTTAPSGHEPYQPNQQATARDYPHLPASDPDKALTASKRMASCDANGQVWRRKTRAFSTATDNSKLNQPLTGSKRKANEHERVDQGHQESKRRVRLERGGRKASCIDEG
ncbi:hypothetical protein N8I77_012207 [Diaporthe amygdali]|uniref:Uncharacterized protein n=1 Tax=Phomopsis amygdali TaxID=1214568 RepID=A0AAD9S499_PHOAM|nr:hypothetical protein N8I77_012207 [Diaporthe amygdali]